MMNNSPRRSARLSQLHSQQSSSTSIFSSSQSPSVSTSSYPSPADELTQRTQDQLRLQLQSQFLAVPLQFNAPLPSPSASDADPIIRYTQSQQNAFSMPEQSQQAAQQSQQQYDSLTVGKGQEHHNSFSSQRRPDMQTGNNPGQLPPDFLAEAARRAQMACLMRDLGDVSL